MLSRRQVTIRGGKQECYPRIRIRCGSIRKRSIRGRLCNCSAMIRLYCAGGYVTMSLKSPLSEMRRESYSFAFAITIGSAELRDMFLQAKHLVSLVAQLANHIIGKCNGQRRNACVLRCHVVLCQLASKIKARGNLLFRQITKLSNDAICTCTISEVAEDRAHRNSRSFEARFAAQDIGRTFNVGSPP